MKRIKTIAVAMGFLLSICNTNALSESLKEQQIFATKMKELLRVEDYDYAKAAMRKYLEIVPDAGPVKRELAHYYMKTKGIRNDTLLDFEYADDDAKRIIGLLNEAVAAAPSDHDAWSLLVYVHALQGNTDLGKVALENALALPDRSDWLDFNSALLALSDGRLSRAVEILRPVAIEKQLPLGPDKHRIYQNSWFTLKNIAFANPQLDPLDSINEGLVTRIDIKELPEYLYAYDKNGPPVVLVISSQDPGCGYCKNDLPELHKFAKRNEREGSKFHIVYASTEPWGNIKHYSDILGSLRVTGIPSYNVIHNGFHMYTWTGSKPAALDALLDEYEKSIRAEVKNKIAVVPRFEYLLDHMQRAFLSNKKANLDIHHSMAFTIDGRQWNYKTSSGHTTQKAADDRALELCDTAARKAGLNVPCRLYAQGGSVVDPEALIRIKAVRSLQAKNKKTTNKNKSKKTKTKKTPTKQSQDSTNPSLLNASGLTTAIRKFEQLSEHYKAFAVAGADNAIVSGAVSNELTQYIANKKALAKCELAKQAMSIESACALRIIGKSTVTDTSLQAIAKLTAKQQKRNAKNSVMKSSYKKYRKLSTDKAFAYSADTDGNWVNGIAFGKRGIDKASTAALEECEAKREEKGLAKECEILILNSKFVEPKE